MAERAPMAEQALLDEVEATPWAKARDRLANPTQGTTYWLTTVRGDGRPHVMPLIGLWLDDAFYFVSGAGTQKARNLADNPHCVVATGSTAVPSVDIVVEGEARRVDDDPTLRHVVGAYLSVMGWPLEVRDGAIYGPNAPTAGPEPYAVYEVRPTTVFGLPGLAGMHQTPPNDRFSPTRWRF